MSEPLRFELRFDDVDAFDREVEANLGRGRVFVPGAVGLETFTPCVVALVHPADGRTLELAGEVVLPPEQQEQLGGVGLQLKVDGDALLAFLCGDDRDDAEPVLAEDPVGPDDAEPAFAEDPGGRDDAEPVFAEELEDGTEGLDEGEPEEAAPQSDPAVRTALEKVRRLNLAQQLKLARGGELSDRVALERLFGRNVWEALLANPRITVAEVAKIGRKGSLPRPLVDVIVANPGWLRAAIVRRALLSNPRLSREGMEKVLRATPKAELKVIEKQVSYAPPVREAARRMLGR